MALCTKMIPGFVFQSYDTEQGKYVGQGFIATTEPTWKDEKGNTMIEPPTKDEAWIELMYPIRKIT